MKKALVLFGNEENTENLIKSSLYFKEKFGYSLTGLLLRDVRCEALSIEQGILYDMPSSVFVGEIIKFEKEEMKSLAKRLKKDNLNIELTYEVGIVEDTIKEHMKSFDLLIIGKGFIVSDTLMEVLKENYKAILIIGNKELKFDNIYIANDDGTRVNRSCYNFINNFPEIKKFISVEENNTEEENRLNSYLISKKRELEVIKKSNSDEIVKYFENLPTNGVIIMGNLSMAYFIEKIIGRTGLKILEKSNIAIYIG